ncbi:MAG: hypothetical protein GWN07_39895, partial [Actinobacteria bacterium]|nr:hypothetical protein [Actinomycetota bacterium]
EPVEVYFSGVGLIPPRISGYVLCNGQAVPDAAIRVVGGDVDQTVRTNAQGKYGATDLGAGFYTAILESAPGTCDFGLRYEVVHARAGQFVDVDFTASN